MSNFALLSCKNCLQGNSSKKHIYLAFYTFRSLTSEFDSYDSCHVTQATYYSMPQRHNCQTWLHGAVKTTYSAIPQRNTFI